MGFKDENKQREANRQAAQRRRDKVKGMTQGMTNQGMTRQGVEPNVIPDRPANFAQPACQCRHCANVRAAGSKHVLNHGPYKAAHVLGRHELNRVSLPGDVDYAGQVA